MVKKLGILTQLFTHYDPNLFGKEIKLNLFFNFFDNMVKKLRI